MYSNRIGFSRAIPRGLVGSTRAPHSALRRSALRAHAGALRRVDQGASHADLQPLLRNEPHFAESSEAIPVIVAAAAALSP